MDVGVVRGEEDIGNEVVLHSGVDLNDVTSLATDIQVVDSDIFKILRSGADSKGMRSVE